MSKSIDIHVYVFPLCFVLLMCIGCKNNTTATTNELTASETVATPVTITAGANAAIHDSIILPATSFYLSNTEVKANINGYIHTVRAKLGDHVNAGQTLFVLETKESKSLGNTITHLDSSFDFSGTTTVKTTTSGYITMLNHQPGDYVQDGEILASMNNNNSFGFVLNLPFEDRQLIRLYQQVAILLPDGTSVPGQVSQVMPQMDSISQTQRVLLKTSAGDLPAGLIAQVVLIKNSSNGFALPRASVYADEQQAHFWVMKLLNDTVAIKIPVLKGLENNTRIGITSPGFSPEDRFVLQGGYGLADTAQIKIQQ